METGNDQTTGGEQVCGSSSGHEAGGRGSRSSLGPGVKSLSTHSQGCTAVS